MITNENLFDFHPFKMKVSLVDHDGTSLVLKSEPSSKFLLPREEENGKMAHLTILVDNFTKSCPSKVGDANMDVVPCTITITGMSIHVEELARPSLQKKEPPIQFLASEVKDKFMPSGLTVINDLDVAILKFDPPFCLHIKPTNTSNEPTGGQESTFVLPSLPLRFTPDILGVIATLSAYFQCQICNQSYTVQHPMVFLPRADQFDKIVEIIPTSRTIPLEVIKPSELGASRDEEPFVGCRIRLRLRIPSKVNLPEITVPLFFYPRLDQFTPRLFKLYHIAPSRWNLARLKETNGIFGCIITLKLKEDAETEFVRQILTRRASPGDKISVELEASETIHPEFVRDNKVDVFLPGDERLIRIRKILQQRTAWDTRVKALQEAGNYLSQTLSNYWLEFLKVSRLVFTGQQPKLSTPDEEWSQFLPLNRMGKIKRVSLELTGKTLIKSDNDQDLSFQDMTNPKNLPTVIFGISGMGKTTCAILLAREQLMRVIDSLQDGSSDDEKSRPLFPFYIDLGNPLHPRFLLESIDLPPTPTRLQQILEKYIFSLNLRIDPLKINDYPVTRRFLIERVQQALQTLFSIGSLTQFQHLWIIDGWDECDHETRSTILEKFKSHPDERYWLMLIRPSNITSVYMEMNQIGRVHYHEMLPFTREDAVDLLWHQLIPSHYRAPATSRPALARKSIIEKVVDYLLELAGEEILSPFYLTLLLNSDIKGPQGLDLERVKKLFPTKQHLIEHFIFSLIHAFIRRRDPASQIPQAVITKLSSLFFDVLAFTTWFLYLLPPNLLNGKNIRIFKKTWLSNSHIKDALNKAMSIITHLNEDSFVNSQNLLWQLVIEILFPEEIPLQVEQRDDSHQLTENNSRLIQESYRCVRHELFLDYLLAKAILRLWQHGALNQMEGDGQTRSLPDPRLVATSYLFWMANEQFDETWKHVFISEPFNDQPRAVLPFLQWCLSTSRLQVNVTIQNKILEEIISLLTQANETFLQASHWWEIERTFRVRLSPSGISRLHLNGILKTLSSEQKNNTLEVLVGMLQQVDSLRILTLSNNQLRVLPQGIGQLTSLKELYLADNHLSALPESIGHLKRLQILDLSRNQLATLPKSIGNLMELRVLSLRENRLITLPESIGQLIALEKLDLRGNQLTTLPESIGQLTNLQLLDLRSNQLSTLPESIGQLTNLEIISLSFNRLISIPDTFRNIVNLQRLDIRWNNLTFLPEEIKQFFNDLKSRGCSIYW